MPPADESALRPADHDPATAPRVPAVRARRAVRIALRLGLGAYLLAVLLVTMWPSPETTAAPSWAQAVLGAVNGAGIPLTIEVLEALANVAMFVPLGVLLVVLGTRPVHAIVAGLLLSGTIETVQLAIPGRVSTLQDVVLNTAGAALGAILAAGVSRLGRRRAGTPRVVA